MIATIFALNWDYNSLLFPKINFYDFVVDLFNSNSLLLFQPFVNPGNEKAMLSTDVVSLNTPLLNGPVYNSREPRSGILHIVRDP